MTLPKEKFNYIERESAKSGVSTAPAFQFVWIYSPQWRTNYVSHKIWGRKRCATGKLP